jgi:alpha/beta hydrolase fold
LSGFFIGSTTDFRRKVESNMVQKHQPIVLAAIQNLDIPVLQNIVQIIQGQKHITRKQHKFIRILNHSISSRDPVDQQKLLDLINSDNSLIGSQPLIGGFHFQLSHLIINDNAKYFNVDGLDLICLNLTDTASDPVVLFFLGNMSQIENMFSFYLDLYKSIGFGFCAFNYRGYGNSKNSHISVPAIAKDSEVIYRFLRDTLGLSNIGIHGVSMGGYPAVYVGSKYHTELKFVVAEKTYKSTELVAEKRFGSQLGQWLVILTGQNTGNMLPLWRGISCKKILIYAESDEVILGDARLIDDETEMVITIENGRHGNFISDEDLIEFKEFLVI